MQTKPAPLLRRTQVCILGAGVTGLAAGVTLAKAGIDALVVERDEAVGGLSRTFNRKGFLFDLGGHRFFTKIRRVNEFVEQLMGDEMIVVKRSSSIYYNQRFFDYPVRFLNVIKNLGLFSGASVVLSYVLTRAKQLGHPPHVISVEDWIVNQFGRKLYDIFFRSYTEKVWGIPGNQLSHDWAAQRIQGFSLATAIKYAIVKSAKERPKTLIEWFTYPARGIGRISDRMAEEIETRYPLCLGSAVTRINHNDRYITSIEYECGNTTTRVQAREFISTLPLTLMIRLMNPAPPARVIQAARSIRFRGLMIVHVAVNRERVTDQSWVYIQEPTCPISRIHEPKNWSALMAPKGKTSLVVEIPYSQGDEISGYDDDEVVRLTTQALDSELHFIKADEVLDSYVIRVPFAYPIYHLGYEQPVNVLVDYLRNFVNLQTGGRAGMHKYINLDHCIECGVQAAENLLGAAHDLGLINTKAEYLEQVS